MSSRQADDSQDVFESVCDGRRECVNSKVLESGLRNIERVDYQTWFD